MRRYCKPIFAVMLSLMLVLLPCIQDSKAVVTTATLAAVLILTVLTAMGITLVVASSGQTKESFLLSRGDTFMQEKGYSGAFDSWLLAGTENEISLKSGFLTITALTSSRIKEYISWLMPNVASNTVIDLSTNTVVPTNQALILGTFSVDYQNLMYINASAAWTGLPNGTLTDGLNTVEISNNAKTATTLGYYDISDTFISQPASDNLRQNTSWSYILFRNMSTYYYTSNGVTTVFPVGTYLFWIEASSGNRLSNVKRGVFTTNNVIPQNGRMFLQDAFVVPEVSASAIVGNYNDLDDLVDITGAGTGGTTVVYNTYYITQSGQALNPSSQDLADIVGALQQALDDINNRIGAIGMTVDAIAAQQVNPPYSDFQLGNLDFSGLGALLTTRFPFSIPWDLKRVFDVFVVEAEAPHWEINLFQGTSFGNKIDGTIEVDLNDYPIVGVVSRWFCIIDLCIFLVFATKKLIWTA